MKTQGTTRTSLAGDFVANCTYTFSYIADAAGYWLCDSGVEAVNNGLAYGFLTLTADESATATPALVTWDTSTLQGMTLSANEITIGETGHYEIVLSLMFSLISPLGGAGYLFLSDWTSGSEVAMAIARESFAGSSVALPKLTWHGPLASGTKLRVQQMLGSGTGTIDGNRSTWPHRDYFWEIRRVR